MQAKAGDRVTIRGKAVGNPDRHGEIVEVRGQDGAGPYVVKFDDGHESVVYPGGDFVLDHQEV